MGQDKPMYEIRIEGGQWWEIGCAAELWEIFEVLPHVDVQIRMTASAAKARQDAIAASLARRTDLGRPGSHPDEIA